MVFIVVVVYAATSGGFNNRLVNGGQLIGRNESINTVAFA